MKKRRGILLFVIFMMAVMLFSVCSDDEHITQSRAEEIAKALTGGEATFVSVEKKENENTLCYIFSDNRGTTFTVTSALCEFGMDGAILENSPLSLSINMDYHDAIIRCNEEKIREILERHGLNDWLGSSFKGLTGIYLEGYVGTPEENQEILNRFISAAVEIDALLSVSIDKAYFEKDEYPFFIRVPYMSICFNKKLEGKDIDEICVDIVSVDFSTSPDARWTFDSLYEEALKDIDSLELVD